MSTRFRIAIVFSLLLFLTSSVEAGSRDYRGVRGGYHHHGGGYYWWGPAIGLGVGLGLWGLSRNYYYNPPSVVIEQPPQIYIEQVPAPLPQAPLREPPYWYYCPARQNYYPYVTDCPNGWLRVAPSIPNQQ